MLVYISHPYGGIKKNADEVEAIINGLLDGGSPDTYISPIHAFGYLYENIDYSFGLDMCLELMEKCDEVLIFGDWQHSFGCQKEISYCERNHIPCQFCNVEDYI